MLLEKQFLKNGDFRFYYSLTKLPGRRHHLLDNLLKRSNDRSSQCKYYIEFAEKTWNAVSTHQVGVTGPLCACLNP